MMDPSGIYKEYSENKLRNTFSHFTDQGKAQFRKEFAEKKLEKLKEKKERKRSHRSVDVSLGRYKLPFKVLDDQGGPKELQAVIGFKNIIERCLKMGYPYVKRHWQSNRIMFLEFEDSVSNEFEKA